MIHRILRIRALGMKVKTMPGAAAGAVCAKAPVATPNTTTAPKNQVGHLHIR